MHLLNIEHFRKATFASLMTMLLILLLLMAMSPLTVAHPGDEIIAPYLQVSVDIDGVWGSGEWDDAPQHTMSNSTGGNIGYIRVKYDSEYLYVLIDSPWDTTNLTLTTYWHENVWLAFDTAHDGAFVNPQSDDYLVHGTTDTTGGGIGMGWIGNGTTWDFQYLGWLGTFMIAQSGDGRNTVGMQPSPNNANPHRISEVMVPLALIGGVRAVGSTVGFYAALDDDSTDPDGYGWTPATAYSEWPIGSGGAPGWPTGWGFAPCPAASAWGNLTLSAPVGGTLLTVDKLSLLAPYIALVSMIAVAAATAIYFTRRKKML